MRTTFTFKAWCGYKGEREATIKISQLKVLIRAIKSPFFTHARCRQWCGQEISSIYHRNPKSPSGVFCEAGGDDRIVSHLLRRYKKTKPAVTN